MKFIRQQNTGNTISPGRIRQPVETTGSLTYGD